MRQPRFVFMPLSLALLFVSGCDCWSNDRPGSCKASDEPAPEACEEAPAEAHADLLLEALDQTLGALDP